MKHNTKNPFPTELQFFQLQKHTVFPFWKQLTPEHILQKEQQPRLPTYQCLDRQTKECTCPNNHACIPLLATRIQLLFHTIKPTPSQILVPFKRNEKPLLRRIPILKERGEYQRGTGTQGGNYKEGNYERGNYKEGDYGRGDYKEGNYESSANDSKNSKKCDNDSKKCDNDSKKCDNDSKKCDNDSKNSRKCAPPTPEEERKNFLEDFERENKSLIKLASAGDVGEIVRGERLSAKETLRRLQYRGGSQAEEKEEVERIWCMWVPRGFERLAVPYRIFRVNRDGLNWVLSLCREVEMPVPHGFYDEYNF